MYQNIKVERYSLRDNVKDAFDVEQDFDSIDGMRDALAGYIFTDIQMTDWHEPIEKAFQSRLQILMSSVLLRALLLKDGMVIALNGNNFPSFYANLKSFLEVSALLGYTVDAIYSDNDYQTLIPKINRVSLGNRKAGGFPVGNVEQISVLTMFDKLDRVIKGMAPHVETVGQIAPEEGILKTMYEDTCNYGHINFNAHMAVGRLHRDGIWRAKQNVDGYKEELYAFYMPGLTMGINAILLCCSLIVRNPKVQNFDLLANPLYFSAT